MTDEDVHGPIDFVLIEYPGDHLTGEAGAALLDLVDAGTIRIWDLMILTKDADGTVVGINIEDLDSDHLGSFTVFAGAETGLLSDDDIQEAGHALEAGTVAALIVYENSWAIPFVAATRRAGGQLVAGTRIPADTVMEVLAAAEAAD
ncbi:DUF6325 family protein [Aquihabitans sp. McL0605]|uniref:DUF6325 family protein n=1 Tax=Aquihabitans sp. McL0605 TaxID=3415671 RepID=UPI003CE6D540